MKRLFITAAIAALFSATAFADGGKKAATETGDKNVSYAALNQFTTDFRSADDVLWTITPNCQKVSFTENNADYTAFYSLNGEYLGLTQKVDFKELPELAQKEIAEQYKGYAVNSVIKYQTRTADEPVVYFIDVKNATSELVVKAAPGETIAFFQKVK